MAQLCFCLKKHKVGGNQEEVEEGTNVVWGEVGSAYLEFKMLDTVLVKIILKLGNVMLLNFVIILTMQQH